jgi:DNA-binding NtrC family response regulator
VTPRIHRERTAAASREAAAPAEPRAACPENADACPAQSTSVVVIGLAAEDMASLREILGCSHCLRSPDCTWTVQSEASVESVLEAVGRGPIALVVCDRDRMGDAWKTLLDRFAGLPRAPLLVVTSRLADDRLWAEALNLGAYDVVNKPFQATEVARIAGLACAHWHHLYDAPAAAMHSVA